MINAQVFLIHYLCESQIFHNLKRNITQQKRRPTASSQSPSFITISNSLSAPISHTPAASVSPLVLSSLVPGSG